MWHMDFLNSPETVPILESQKRLYEYLNESLCCMQVLNFSFYAEVCKNRPSISR